MKVVFTVTSLEPRFGGPARSVPSLACALNALNIETEIIEGSRASEAYPSSKGAHVKTQPIANVGLSFRPFGRAEHFGTTVSQALNSKRPTLLHDNGIWLGSNHCAVMVARRQKISLVISPRGMLSDWALAARKWKKRAAWLLYQRRDLQSSCLLHATSHQEANELRNLGLGPPIAIVPNGVEVPEEKAKSRKHKKEGKTVLFLSRLHLKKGILDLVKAWASVEDSGQQKTESRKPGSKWRVILAGYDENGHLEEVKAESRKLKVENDFEFVGPVEGDAKWDLYRSADLFVLPSYSENFGIVIAEALACGIPVITTRATPWQELESHRCGWWIPTGPEALAIALQQAMALSDSEREEMGARGRELILSKYTWPAIGEEMKRVYEWVLGMGEKPACIV